MPRWRLPVLAMLSICLSGCAARTEQGSKDTGMAVPSVRMALVKIPLNGVDHHPLEGEDPIERFIPEPVAVAYQPAW